MTFKTPPSDRYQISANGYLNQIWRKYFTELVTKLNGPVQMPEYTVSGVPEASEYTGYLVYITDESGGAVPAFSDGTDWRRVTDRAVISS